MDILVYTDWEGMEAPTPMGVLSVTHTRGHVVFTFSYDKQWIKTANAQNLDPDLQWYEGSQFLPGNKPNFGLFLDSSPDRWGRVLMDRREAILARRENRKPKPLYEEDYLLGVYDAYRMGALRFKLEKEGPFLNDNQGLAAHPFTSL
jgi:serine/threonine-protein kinase HipA